MRPTDAGGIRALLTAGVVLLCVVLGASAAADPGPVGVSSAGLSPSAERAFLDRGAVVVASRSQSFPEAYDELASRGVPLFVTSDSVLLTTRLFVDGVLHHVENSELYDRLETLSRELVRISEEQYIVASDPAVKEAARMNLAFFAVGLSLLDPDYFPPEFVRSLVERELALIEDARALSFSPIMGPTPLDDTAGPGEDYRSYAPVGRYADDERSMRFSRATTWYGRMAFALPEGRVEDRMLTVQALLVVRALMSEGGEWLELWERVQEPLSFFMGVSGDPTVSDYMEQAVDIYGDEFDPELLADVETVDEFISRISETAQPHFETHQLRGMRFLCRRDYPDAGNFGRIARGEERDLPSLLDLMSLLGSASARAVLEELDTFGDDVYRRGYDEIEVAFETMTYAEWTRDLYWSWLYALSASFEEPTGGPAFTRSPAWETKSLSTAAAAWAVLQHQSASTAPGRRTGPGRELRGASSPVLVEPTPALYARLRELVENMEDRLLDHYLLDEELGAEFDRFCVFLTTLEHFSIGVLDKGRAGGTAPAFDDYAETMLTLTRGAAGRPCARTAVVYYDHDSRTGLFAAAGSPDLVYVVSDAGDGPTLYGGVVFSFYEDTTGVEDAPPDREWQHALASGAAVRPWWALRVVVE